MLFRCYVLLLGHRNPLASLEVIEVIQGEIAK